MEEEDDDDYLSSSSSVLQSWVGLVLLKQMLSASVGLLGPA